MKTTLTRALWVSAMAALSAPGCANDQKDASSSTEMTAQASGEADSPLADPASPPPHPIGGVSGSEGHDKAEMVDTEAQPAPEAIKSADTGGALRGQKKGRTAAGMLGKSSRRPMPARPISPGPGHIGIANDNDQNSEDYQNYGTNPMVDTSEDHLSTFAIDVDTASYAIARRKINEGHVPPANAVRVEEFVNYFKYEYAGPTNGAPFAVHMDMAPSPFSRGKNILRVGVQGKKLAISERKPSHLVFLVDVSGSMSSPDKLGLAKRALRVLVDNLKDSDTVALVTYAGNTRVVLEPTGVSNKATIMSAIEDLTSGGSTAMASGIELSYQLAAKNLSSKSESRVIVLSDGDANVGKTNHKDILGMISGKVKEGVTLTTIGFGMGNYKDTMMEQLANKGNGNYFYVDSSSDEAKPCVRGASSVGHAPDHRQGRQDPGRLRQGRGCPLSPDWIREPRHRRSRFPQ